MLERKSNQPRLGLVEELVIIVAGLMPFEVEPVISMVFSKSMATIPSSGRQRPLGRRMHGIGFCTMVTTGFTRVTMTWVWVDPSAASKTELLNNR